VEEAEETFLVQGLFVANGLVPFLCPSVHELKESVLKYERDKNQKRKIRMTKTRNELVRPVVDVEPVPRLTCEQ
jgi:hypothetical protein